MSDEKKMNLPENKDDALLEEESVRQMADSDSLKNDKEIKAVSFKKIAIIIAIVVVLAIVAMVCAIFLQPEPDQIVDNTRPVSFSSFIKANVTDVEIERADGSSLSFTQDAEGNIVMNGDPDVALNSLASTILTNSAAVRARDTVFDDQEKASECGFDDPTIVANVSYDDGSSVHMTVGSKTSKGSTYYVMIDGYEGIYEMDGTLPNLMLRDPKDFRQYDVLPVIDPSLIDELKYTANGQTVHFKPYGDDEFNYSVLNLRMLSPYEIDADTESYSNLITSLTDIAFKGFAGEGDLKQFGLDEPAVSLYMHDTKGVTIDILIGDKTETGDYYVTFADDTSKVYIIDDVFVTVLTDTPVSQYIGSFIGLMNFAVVNSVYVETDDAVYDMNITREVKYEEDGKTVATDNNGNTLYLYDYEINGKETEEEPFKAMYTELIGITIDGTTPTDENGELPEIATTGGMKITYGFYDETQEKVTVEFRPYMNLHYAQRMNDNPFWFISAKEKIETALKAVESVATTGKMPEAAE